MASDCLSLLLVLFFSVPSVVATSPTSSTSPSPSLAQECAAQLSHPNPLPEFVSWLKAFPNLEMEQIDIQVINGERGVVAKHAIQAGSLILHLPSSALISDHTMFSDPYWSERGTIFKSMMEVDAFIPMALRLWHEAYDYQANTTPQLAGHAPTRCSPYLPWLRMLPHNYTTPPYMGNDDFDLIERLAPGSSITAELRYQSSNLFITYTYVMRHVYNAHPHLFKAKPNWEQFRRFHQTVRTRCWNDHLMAPFLDMLNHDSDMRSPRYNHDTHEFHLFASRDLLPGDEIYQSYGRITDREAMLAYGFVATKNTHNTVEVEIDWQEAEYPALALHFNLSNTITFMSGDLLPLETLRIMRVFSITSDDNSLYSDIDVPMSSKNEMEMFRRLLKICQSQLSIYSTTIEQDEAMLQSSSLPYIHRMMILYVMHQKQLLHRVMDEITRRFWTCTIRVCEYRDARRYMAMPNRLYGKWQARDCHDCTPTCQC